jgi:two-component system OmpR family response regulator
MSEVRGISTGASSGTPPEARLLVVEDDPNIVELLSASLRYAGSRCTRPATGRAH